MREKENGGDLLTSTRPSWRDERERGRNKGECSGDGRKGQGGSERGDGRKGRGGSERGECSGEGKKGQGEVRGERGERDGRGESERGQEWGLVEKGEGVQGSGWRKEGERERESTKEREGCKDRAGEEKKGGERKSEKERGYGPHTHSLSLSLSHISPETGESPAGEKLTSGGYGREAGPAPILSSLLSPAIPSHPRCPHHHHSHLPLPQIPPFPSPVYLRSLLRDPSGGEDAAGEASSSSIYHSPEIFGRYYAEMVRSFRVFVYPDGDPNTYYQTPRKLTGKYASEGYFFQNIRESTFRTDDPDKADLFFIPISCHKMRGKGTSYENMTIIVQNYVEGLIAKYPYWNRTLGADHFFVTCHDVGVRATEGLHFLVKNAIRVVCSPSYDVGFIPHKDVALPQVLQPFALPAGGNDIENRTVLGFWAGHRNSKIRVILARVWENDTELAISNNRISRSTGELVYQKRFYRTKFCICPGGSQVNSARIADSIHYGCIPVILSNYYDLPFNDILDWQKFSLVLKENDVYQLKSILKSVSDEEFIALHKRLVEVQKHFEWHSPPSQYDAFHMVMYELWLRRHVIKY